MFSVDCRVHIWCFPSRSVITYKYNTSVNNTTLYLYTINIVYSQGDMFRPLLGHLQALWEKRSKNCPVIYHFYCIQIKYCATDCRVCVYRVHNLTPASPCEGDDNPDLRFTLELTAKSNCIWHSDLPRKRVCPCDVKNHTFRFGI